MFTLRSINILPGPAELKKSARTGGSKWAKLRAARSRGRAAQSPPHATRGTSALLPDPFPGPRGPSPCFPGLGRRAGRVERSPTEHRGHAWHKQHTHTHRDTRRAGVRRAAPPGGAGRRGKGSLKAAHQRGAGRRGPARGGGGAAREGGWGSGSGRGSPLRAYVCQGAADAAARDKVEGERRGRGQTRQPPRWEAAPRSNGSASTAKASGGDGGGPGSPARPGAAGQAQAAAPAPLSQQPSSARFHPPPHPASLRPPRPSASRSPSAAALGFRDKVGGGGKGGLGGVVASICLSTEG